ncbi:protein ZAR1-like isoform 2-T2 [Spinachia spinachia]
MEGFLSTCPAYSVAVPAQNIGWAKRESRFLIPHGLNYLELCKAILAQVHPGAPPPPFRRALTKECGVQVNAKVDKIVQCSLGPKTLLCAEGHRPGSPRTAESPQPIQPEGKAPYDTPPLSQLRYRRPVSIYSPVFDRRFFTKKLYEDGSEDEDEADAGEPAGREAGLSGEVAVPQGKTPLRGPSKGSSFQFLEQRYGFFHCKKCNIRWESAYVWCISGTSKVYYKQLCRKCQVGFNPYRVESILCKGCSQTCCSCEKKQRHINMKRPHRQDLCCRCKGTRLSCDVTYSFKYIV